MWFPSPSPLPATRHARVATPPSAPSRPSHQRRPVASLSLEAVPHVVRRSSSPLPLIAVRRVPSRCATTSHRVAASQPAPDAEPPHAPYAHHRRLESRSASTARHPFAPHHTVALVTPLSPSRCQCRAPRAIALAVASPIKPAASLPFPYKYPLFSTHLPTPLSPSFFPFFATAAAAPPPLLPSRITCAVPPPPVHRRLAPPCQRHCR